MVGLSCNSPPPVSGAAYPRTNSYPELETLKKTCAYQGQVIWHGAYRYVEGNHPIPALPVHFQSAGIDL